MSSTNIAKFEVIRANSVFPLAWIFLSFLHQITGVLTFKRRIKSHMPFAGVIRSSPYSPRFQDKG